MKTVSIVPTTYLDCIKGEDYHLALAHLINNDYRYMRFYKHCEDAHVILDNGVYENAQVSITELLSRALRIKANEIILIDKMENRKVTLQSARYDFFLLNKQLGSDRSKWPNIMAVAQGENLEDWYKCAVELLALPIDCIAIPKILLKYGSDARIKAIKSILPYLEGRDIHLLGGGDDPFEAHKINQELSVSIRSVDSSLPYVYAIAGKDITDGKRPNIIIDFNEPQKCDKELLINNINKWKDGI